MGWNVYRKPGGMGRAGRKAEESVAVAPCHCLALAKGEEHWSAWNNAKGSGFQVGRGYMGRQPTEPDRKRLRMRQWGARLPGSCPGTAKSTTSTVIWLQKQPWTEEKGLLAASTWAFKKYPQKTNKQQQKNAWKISTQWHWGTYFLMDVLLLDHNSVYICPVLLSMLNWCMVCSGSPCLRTAKLPHSLLHTVLPNTDQHPGAGQKASWTLHRLRLLSSVKMSHCLD